MATKRRMVQIQLTVDPKELAAFDKLIAKGEGNRSLAIRLLMRQAVAGSLVPHDVLGRGSQTAELRAEGTSDLAAQLSG